MKRPERPRATGDIEWHFLEARRLMELGKNHEAMELAGFGIRLDLERPEGYLLLGEMNLREGDLVEARRSFRAALARSRGETKCAALAGLAQVAWVAGDLQAARSAYEDALAEDASDPLNLRPALVEILLGVGDIKAARSALAKCEDASADVLLLSALTRWKLGDSKGAAVDVRRACLENAYLASLLRGEEVPDFGLVHGVEEAGPEHATALVERLRPLLRADSAVATFVVAVASAPGTRREGTDLVSLAARLQAEPMPARRARLLEDLERLRDPERIANTSDGRQSFEV